MTTNQNDLGLNVPWLHAIHALNASAGVTIYILDCQPETRNRTIRGVFVQHHPTNDPIYIVCLDVAIQ